MAQESRTMEREFRTLEQAFHTMQQVHPESCYRQHCLRSLEANRRFLIVLRRPKPKDTQPQTEMKMKEF